MKDQFMSVQRVPAAVWRERIEQLNASGLSIASYAEQFSYPLDRLRYWSQRLCREEQAPPFVPVRVRSSMLPAAIELHGPSGCNR
jgi:hypothetical protein